jgi:hypothetical protein
MDGQSVVIVRACRPPHAAQWHEKQRTKALLCAERVRSRTHQHPLLVRDLNKTSRCAAVLENDKTCLSRSVLWFSAVHRPTVLSIVSQARRNAVLSPPHTHIHVRSLNCAHGWHSATPSTRSLHGGRDLLVSVAELSCVTQAGSAPPDSTATIVSSAGSATAQSAKRRSVATCVALLWNHRSSRNASQMRCGSTSRNCMRVLRCRARLADRRRARLANSKGSLVKSPHRILSIARCVVSIRSSTCCAVVIALRMQTRATANGTDGKRTQHLALCDDGGDERQRGPRATRKALVDLGQHRRRHHRQHPQHLEHGLESFCRAPARRRPHRR